MNETEITRYLTESLEGVDVVSDRGNSFFCYNPPDSGVAPDHHFPFVTLVVNDLYDQFSNLDRPAVFRLNIGIGKQTFRALFGDPREAEGGEDAPMSGYDFSALDQVMPHPVYGRLYWVCVLSPSERTFATQVRPLLTEAYALAVSRRNRLTQRG